MKINSETHISTVMLTRTKANQIFTIFNNLKSKKNKKSKYGVYILYMQKPWYGPLRLAAGFCSVTVAVCEGLALKGHRWEPATLIFMSLASLHNYHI